MMHQWLSMLAIIAKSPPHTTPVCPAPSSNTFLYVLLVLLFLALLGVLATGVWMFRSGRWRLASSNRGVAVGNALPPVYRRPAVGSNLPPPPRPSPSVQAVGPPMRPPSGISPQESPLRNTRWLGLAQDCADLFDELDENMSSFEPSEEQMARHVKNRLREILIHSNVEAIARDRTFDENRHQLERSDATAAAGTPIVVVSPGFAVERRVLRRAVVRVASEGEM